MGLRCSLLGHAYGESVTEHDRERRGDEEVVTVTKLRTCTRCGAETVLSENTEVRHLDSVTEEADREPPAMDDSDPVESPGTEPTTAPAEPTASAVDTDTEDAAEPDVAEIIETAEGSDTTAPGSQPTASTTAESGTEGSDSETPVTDERGPAVEPTDKESEVETDAAESDDGIIIEDSTDSSDDSAPETAPEQEMHPADSTDREEESPSGRDSIDDIEETAAEAAADSDADRMGARASDQPRDATDSTAEPESMFGTATEETPDRESDSTESEPEEERDAWKERPPSETPTPADTSKSADQTADRRTDPAYQFESPGDTETEGGSSTAAQRGPSGIASEGPLDVDVEEETPYDSLVCPECGFSESAVSSLRAGDICPECHRGYLAGRR